MTASAPTAQVPSRAEFAQMVIAALRAAGETTRAHYDAEQNLFILGGDGETAQSIYLEELYCDFANANEGYRKFLLKLISTDFLLALKPLPKKFEDVAQHLFPVVGSRFLLENHGVPQTYAESDACCYDRPFAWHLNAFVVCFRPDLAYLSQRDLDAWEVSFKTAFDQAKQNLLKRQHTFEALRESGGVVLLDTIDGFDSSRLVLPELFTELKLNGAPVVMVPHEYMLLVTGEHDTDGLRIILERVNSCEDRGKANGYAFRLSNGRWRPWLPAPSHPLRNQFKASAMQTLSLSYAMQEKVLLAREQKKPPTDQLFISSHVFRCDEFGSPLPTVCCWPEKTSPMLPEVDLIDFSHGKEITGFVAWQDVIEVMGDDIQPQGMYPERYLAESFPTVTQFAKMVQAKHKRLRRLGRG